jgi:hypothetical protein
MNYMNKKASKPTHPPPPRLTSPGQQAVRRTNCGLIFDRRRRRRRSRRKKKGKTFMHKPGQIVVGHVEPASLSQCH